MKIEFFKVPELKEPKLQLQACERDARAEEILEQLERMYSDTLRAYDGDRIHILRQADILRVYAEDARVFCQTEAALYTLRSRLYEMEEILDPECFVRISKCEIVNKSKILRLDVSLSGTVGVTLEGNIKTYTSRRYMQTLKAVFGL